MASILTPEKALIFRITHVRNIPWILENGIHCRNALEKDPNFVNIGNLELIDKRQTKNVPLFPYGTLSDYVPFYFTPFSPMMYNIHTGYGVPQKSNSDIVILVSSLRNLAEQGQNFIYTDRHAYLATANYYTTLSGLKNIDWSILQNRDFKRNIDDPEKVERYQAEALIYKRLQIDSLIGMVCYTDELKDQLNAQALERGFNLDIKVMRNWYFR